jgi:hypothetical protein
LSPKESRGVDTRFKKDAQVMILSSVTSYLELQQMVGRSSRSRGVCDGTLYIVGNEKQYQVIDRIKRQGVAALQEKEKLICLIESKMKDITLIRKLTEVRDAGRSL